MNVLLIVLDDTHTDAFAKMPYLASMPDGRWTRFNKALHNNPYCGPSRATMNTGRTSRSHGVIDHGTASSSTCRTWDLNNAANMLPTWLRSKGVRTGLTGKHINGYPWLKGDTYVPPGYDGGGWFGHLDDGDLGGAHATHNPAFVNYALCENGVVNAYAAGDSWTTTGADASGRVITTTKYFTDNANLRLQTFMDGPQPWFFNLSQRATHGTILVPTRHQSPFSVAAADVHLRPSFNQAAGADWDTMPAWLRAKAWRNPAVPADLAEIDAWKADQVEQWRCVQAVDESLRDAVTKLKALGQFDNTVIIILSDNGWLRGEHRIEKKNVCYEGSIRNEIWIRHPSAALGNRTSPALVQNTDLAPTIAEIAGVRPSRAFNGQSFLPLVLNGSDAGWRDTAYIESYDVDNRGAPAFEGVVTATHKLVQLAPFGAFPAEDELYDLVTHPDETRNVVNDPAYAAVKADLTFRLSRLKAAAAA